MSRPLDVTPRPWSDEELCDYFDSYYSVTLAQLAKLAHRDLEDVKRVLLNPQHLKPKGDA